jgi:uncharacterized membrane protein
MDSLQPEQNSNEKIIALLEKQQALLEVIEKQNKKIGRHIFWMAVGDYVRILLVIVPLILAAIFLPPLLKDVTKQYQELLGVKNSASNFDIQSLINQFQK